jgi:hypothetical protein
VTNTTHDDLAKRLANARCEGLDELCWAAADRIEELEAKLATCEKYRDTYAVRAEVWAQAVRDLEAKLAKAMEYAQRHFTDATLAAITETPHD